MFQYTTETIINSNSGKLPGNKRFGVIGVGDAALISDSSATGEDFLVVDGVNTFKIKYIKSIYKTAYRDSAKATATLDLTSATIPAAGSVVRLTVALSERGSVRSSIQNAYLHKNRPFHYELEVKTGTAAGVVDDLVKLIKKDMALTDFAFFSAAADASGKKLVLTADDCYIQFDAVKLEEVVEGVSAPLAARLLGANSVQAIAGLSEAVITPGDEGQGTVTRLVKNLRIPTNASINPFAADQGGKPVPGGKYTQYLIEYETPRAHVSGTVMGSVGEVSRTSHVFFIESAIVSAWDAELARVVAANSALSAVQTAGRGVLDTTANPATVSGASAGVSVNDDEIALTSKTEMGSVE